MSTQAQKQAEQQRKTFLRLVNGNLKKGGYDPINDLVEDMPTGIYLTNFINTLGEKKKGGKKKSGSILIAPEKAPKTVYARLSNLNAVLNFLKKEEVPLVNIGAEDLDGKSEKLVLGLLWTLILHFSSEASGSALLKEMLKFINEILNQHYSKFGVKPIDDLIDDAIRDGRAFSVLNYHFNSPENREKLHEFQREPADKAKHFDDALEDGQNTLGVSKLLDGEDMNGDAVPDAKSVMAQIFEYMALKSKQNEAEFLKDQLNKKMAALFESKAKADALKKRTDDLIKWINETIAKMENQPGDIHPNDLKGKKEYLDDHFNNQRKPKSDEYNKIMSDTLKMRQDNLHNNLPTPNTGFHTLNSAWQNLTQNERIFINYIEEKLGVYRLVENRRAAFEFKLKNLLNSASEVDAEARDVSEKSKTATLANIQNYEVNFENASENNGYNQEAHKDLQEFADSKIKSVCPSPSYFDETFQAPINKANNTLADSTKKVGQAKNDLDEAKKRCNKVGDNLKQNYKDLSYVKAHVDRANVLLETQPTFQQSADLKDYCEDLDKVATDKMKAKLDACANRDKENSEITGNAVENPFTTMTVDELRPATENLVNAITEKKNSLEGERARLDALENKAKEFEEKSKDINSALDEINAKIDTANATENDVSVTLQTLDDISVLTLNLDPKIAKLQEEVADMPQLASQTNQLRSRLDETNNSIIQAKGVLTSKPATNQEDMSLTDAEVKKITAEFNSNDNARNGKITFEGFKAMCVSYPPFGMSIAENSPEQQSFFSSYSSDKAHLELKEVINGYSEYKVNFTIKSKDKVFEMLRSRADSDQHVSEESLNGLLNADVLKAVKEQIQPIQKNGQNYYHLNDLL